MHKSGFQALFSDFSNSLKNEANLTFKKLRDVAICLEGSLFALVFDALFLADINECETGNNLRNQM